MLFILYFVSDPESESESESIRSLESESEQSHHDSTPLCSHIMGKLFFPFFPLLPWLPGDANKVVLFFSRHEMSQRMGYAFYTFKRSEKCLDHMRSLNHDAIWRHCQLYLKIVLGICRRTKESVYRLVRFVSLQPRAPTGRRWPKDLADTPLFAAIS